MLVIRGKGIQLCRVEVLARDQRQVGVVMLSISSDQHLDNLRSKVAFPDQTISGNTSMNAVDGTPRFWSTVLNAMVCGIALLVHCFGRLQMVGFAVCNVFQQLPCIRGIPGYGIPNSAVGGRGRVVVFPDLDLGTCAGGVVRGILNGQGL